MVLAPMADVTDAAFRQIIAIYGKPDVTFTEFVSADGLMHPVARPRLLADLAYTAAERPIVAQLFTGRPAAMEGAAALVARLGFDGIDINMGCPDRGVEKQGAGAALIKTPVLARELIRAAKRGAESAGRPLPVSVKTRLGYSRDELETWLPELLAEAPAVVTMHARTRAEMSKVPARWERVARAVEIRNALGARTLIMGNGDVQSVAEARERATTTGADGVMLGRAIFGNPWLFNFVVAPILRERLQVLLEHTKLFEKLFTGHKSFAVMKKHFKAYVPNNTDLRLKLMSANTAAEVEQIVAKTKFSI